MSYVNFSPGLFLGKQELEKFQDILKQNRDFFYKTNLLKPGLFYYPRNAKNASNPAFLIGNNNDGSDGILRVGWTSYAIDDSYNLITLYPTNIDISSTDPNYYYWIKVRYATSYLELGYVDISVDGTITAKIDSSINVTPDFTKLFRGFPDTPSKIKFFGGSVNTSEYEIQEVVDSTTLYISGNLQAETNMKFAVVGSFTPDLSVQESYKYPFRYDSYKSFTIGENSTFTVVKGIDTYDSVSEDVPPGKLGQYSEFYIAKVRYYETAVPGIYTTEIIDKRGTEYAEFIWE